MPENNLGGIAIPLSEGADWDDELAVTMKRDEWASMLAASVAQGIELRALLDDLRRKASDGEFVATLIGPQVEETAEILGEAIRKVTEVILPDLAADAREEAHRRAVERSDA